MQITSHNYSASFQGLTKDSKKIILDEICELRHNGKDTEASSAYGVMKRLDKKAGSFYKVVYGEEYIMLKDLRSKQVYEFTRGFFSDTPLYKFLGKAYNFIENLEFARKHVKPKRLFPSLINKLRFFR